MRAPRLARTLLSATFLISAAVALPAAGIGIALVKREAAHLPDVGALRDHRPATTSRLLSSDGAVIGRFAEQNRTPVALASVPPVVVQAFVSAEDRAFWRHDGVDPVAVARAALTNFRLRGTGRRPIGASTITQQVVKNLLVGDEASFRRKVREALMARRLEREIGKERVLEIYLNEIYLGEGTYGIAAAAEAYFGRPLAEIGLADAAFLAALPKGPSNYDPVRRPDAARARRAYVLGRMVEDGAITQGQADEAHAAPLPIPSGRGLGGVGEGYFAEEARREIVARLGSASLYRGGLTVHTSMDAELQALADRTLRGGLAAFDRRHGYRGPVSALPAGTRLADPASWRPALAAVEPPSGAEDWKLAAVLGFGREGAVVGLSDGATAWLTLDGLRWARRAGARGLGAAPRRAEDAVRPGEVLLVEEVTLPSGSRRLELRQIPEIEGSLVAVEIRTGRVVAVAGGFSHERSAFNRATQARRQPGSTFKPFIYLTAFENGYDPTSPVIDAPIAIEVGSGAPRWRPDGGAGAGLMTARRALETSRNLAAVRLLYDLGLEQVSGTARRFGLYDALPNYAAALGALETTNLRLTSAYAAIANGGRRVTPSLIDLVDGPDGQPIAARAAPPTDGSNQVADPVAAAQIVSVLEGVVSRGTAASSLARIDQPLSGKTGTTNDNHDAWFVGFSPDLAVGVHLGYDRPRSMGGDETGGHVAAPVFGEFMRAALALRPPSARTFVVPPGARVVRVDPTSGESVRTGGTVEILRDPSAFPARP